MKRTRFKIYGRVQGVGFRYSTLQKAHSLGVTGFVRNKMDGSVESVAEGNDSQLQAFEEYLRQGPTFARVEKVFADTDTVKNREYSDFHIK